MRNTVTLFNGLVISAAVALFILSEYRSAGLESFKFQLFSPAPISKDYEQMKLTGSFYFLVERVGTGDRFIKKIFSK